MTVPVYCIADTRHRQENHTMWIITETGFLSAVAHDTDPNMIRVRARTQEHLVHSLGPVDVIEMPDADYRWHANVSRALFIDVLTDAVLDMEYTSHVKESVAGDDPVMYSAMLACWTALHRLQETDFDRTAWAHDQLRYATAELS